MFGIKFVTDYVTRRRSKASREMLKAHEAAVLASTGGMSTSWSNVSHIRAQHESRDTFREYHTHRTLTCDSFFKEEMLTTKNCSLP